MKYVVILRDRGTGFVITTATKDKCSETVLYAVKSIFISIFGIPSVIITDNGREFISSEFRTFCEGLDIKHKFITSYHPQSNGLVERVNRIIKVAMRSLNDTKTWPDALPLITLMINNQISDTNNFTPHQMTFGQAAILPGTFFL